ncbi:ATP-binding protein [Robiginitalea sp. IMCC44478]|uniref:ATP-binding protein n=1 Tax=Robiginitalea sp. IMCC44478 TaxID=3459122 RepID=UPI00404254B0
MKNKKVEKFDGHSIYERLIAVLLDFKPVEDLKHIVHPEFMGYGSAAHEIFRTREDLRKMAEMQAQQLKGQEFKYTRTSRRERLFANGAIYLILEEFKLYFSANDHQLDVRVSTLLEKTEGKWQVTHFHGSSPDSDIAEEEAFPDQGLRRKNEELEAKIRERTRELEIEAAMERVRARAMAMQQSDELSDLVDTVFKELTGLDMALSWCMINIIDEASMSNTVWGANPQIGKPPESYHMLFEDFRFHHEMYRAWKERKKKWVIVLEGKEKEVYDNYLFSETEFRRVPASVQEQMKASERYVASFTFSNFGGLQTVGEEPLSKDSLEILSRFGKVFDLTYTRFNDLLKAEAQAREAEIELALERVRARTMAMQHSDELAEASHLLDEQVRALGIKTWGCAFNIYRENDSIEWFGNEAGLLPTYTVPREGIFKEYYDAGQKGETLLVKEFSGDVCIAHYEYMSTLPVVGEVLQQLKKTNGSFPDYQIDHVVYFKYGYLLFITRESVPEAHDIFRRFAGVFEQTYTRFLDLKKAEEQAREAQIELSLERIRAQVTAMQESSELLDIVVTMRTEFVKLGHQAHYFWHMRWLPERYEKAMTSGDGTRIGMVMELPRHMHGDISLLATWEKSDESTVVYAMDAEEAVAYVDKMVSLGDFQQIDPQAPSSDDIRHIGGLTFVMARTTHGEIGFSLPGMVPEPPAEALETLVRFAGVFDLAYRRFEDLKEAEKQKREAEIELALERVRARTMAMHNSNELEAVIKVIFEQFVALGIHVEHTGFILDYKNRDDMHIWLADHNAIQPEITFPYFDSPHWNSFLKARESGDSLFTNLLSFDEKNRFYKDLFEHLPEIPEEVQAHYFKVPGLAISTVLMDTVGLYIENFEAAPYSERENEVLIRFGKVFQQTYTRFLDLKNAEARAREAKIETALERVRARTMAMHRSDELSEVVALLYEQIQILGFNDWGCSIIICNEEARVMRYWYAEVNLSNLPFYCDVPLTNKIVKKTWDLWLSGTPQFEISLLGKEKEDYTNFMLNDTAYNHILPEDVKEEWRKPEDIFFAYFTFKYGLLEIVDVKALDSGNYPTYRRFVQVIEQTYTRFLDLKNAEARAREAKIETALERVRSRSMAMHKSEELVEVATVLHTELTNLEVSEFSDASIVIFDEPNNQQIVWGARTESEYLEKSVMPLLGDKILQELYDNWHSGEAFFTVKVGGSSLKNHNEFVYPVSQRTELEDRVLKKMPDPTFFHCAVFAMGYLELMSDREIREESALLLRRFAKVFDQTYTRFLDLKKAEAQAREAKIETALERVRARTMAMQQSEELSDVAVVLFEQLQGLGGNYWGCGLGLCKKDATTDEFWFAYEKGILPPAAIPNTTDPAHKRMYQGWVNNSDFVAIEASGKELKEHYKYMMSLPEVRPFFQEILDKGLSFPEWQQWNAAYFKHGYLLIITLEPYPEPEILNRFAKVFEQTYTRFLDLKKAEAQAREAQIETALEKVRTRTMAMQKGEELKEVAVLLYKELLALGVTNFVTCGYVEVNEEAKRQFTWVTSPGGDTMDLFYLPLNGDATFDERYAAWKRQQTIFHQTVAGEVRNSHLEFAITTFNSKEAEEMVRSQFPDPTVFYCFNFSHGYLHLVCPCVLTEQEEVLLARFTRVFEQTYARFLDLKKAEAQAREAQIENALEKVRSRTMAMQHSDELPQVVATLYEQLVAAGIDSWMCVLALKNEKTGGVDMLLSNKIDTVLPKRFEVMPLEHRIWKEFYNGWEEGVSFKVIEYEGKEKREYEDLLINQEAFNELSQEQKKMMRVADRACVSVYYMKEGMIQAVGEEKLPEEKNQILIRFAKAFEQTYTRFSDLKKAEAQAREAQIEAALEKVRSRTMAMQRSDELPEAANILFLQVQELGIPAWSAGYCIWTSDDKKATSCNMSSEGELQKPFILPSIGEGYNFYDPAREGKDFYVAELGGDALVKHYDFMSTLPSVGEILDELRAAGLSLPTFQIFHIVYFPHGFLMFITYEPVPEAHEIFKRFGKVFEQTYTRFQDLQRAEAQTRESKIETALERVRARALAMQEPEELMDVARVLRREMGLLGVEELETSSIYIHDNEVGKTECWFAIKDIREQEKVMVSDHFSLDLKDTWVGRQMLKFYESAEEQVSIEMKGEERKEWINYCEKHSSALRGYYGEEIPERTYHLYKFSHGAIGAATPAGLSDESWNLLKRAALVFSLAYSRFRDLTQARLDLQRLKEEKKRAEDALKELQLTQQQLVHAEKMASLGELTAGIAHEIQNPLNFVNNFSEVSEELLEELLEELENGDLEESKALLQDIVQNLQKISHHGKRADGIVKGMLQHSRAGGNTKEPTDINALADEYLRLAYHGLRAKDKSFNATMETDFDETIVEMKVIPQDIGRVLLNLITNAFHAVSQRKSKESENYVPTVWITTRKTSDGVEISVQDNGEGIPENIKEKIFQPFFTTKPTGEGTGLGLSMSYDIVTKGHGGTLEVESKAGKGSCFTIILPIKNQLST